MIPDPFLLLALLKVRLHTGAADGFDSSLQRVLQGLSRKVLGCDRVRAKGLAFFSGFGF